MASTFTIRNILAGLGAVTAASTLYRLARFSWLYLRPSSLPKYVHPDSYALVTGATAGIGKGFVQNLLAQGSNVVIHGRDENKLTALQSELQQQYPDRKILTVSASASDPEEAVRTIKAFIEEQDLNVTILINNLGGTAMFGVPSFQPLVDWTSKAIGEIIDVNVVFSVRVTQVMLPLLGRLPSKATMKARPSLIMNISSYAGMSGLPLVTIYAGCKAFLAKWSAALSLELSIPTIRSANEPVEVLGIITGAVQSQGNQEKDITLTVPTSEDFAAAALRRIGCGRRLVVGHFWQAFATGFVDSLPEKMAERFMTAELNRRWEEDKKSR